MMFSYPVSILQTSVREAARNPVQWCQPRIGWLHMLGPFPPVDAHATSITMVTGCCESAGSIFFVGRWRAIPA
jgi:hypothetical protein